jgi:Rrf2 family protein
MVQLAADAPEASTTRQIAAKTKVPSAYLAKVLQSMRRAGLIHSRRGVGGGVTLAHEPKHIRLLEVIDAVEPLKRGGAKTRRASPLQRTLDAALAEVRKMFLATSLADMLPGARPRKAGGRKRKKRGTRKAARRSE